MPRLMRTMAIRSCASAPARTLRERRDLLCSIINTGIERREIRRGVDVRRLATQSYVERYLETEVRRGKKSTTLSCAVEKWSLQNGQERIRQFVQEGGEE